MKHISRIVLFLALSIQVVFAIPENSVEEANDYLIITTYNETGETRPMVWTLRKKIIQSVDFADIHGAEQNLKRFHVGLTPPIVFDCRMKPWYTEVLAVDPATKKLVDGKIKSMLPAQWR